MALSNKQVRASNTLRRGVLMAYCMALLKPTGREVDSARGQQPAVIRVLEVIWIYAPVGIAALPCNAAAQKPG